MMIPRTSNPSELTFRMKNSKPPPVSSPRAPARKLATKNTIAPITINRLTTSIIQPLKAGTSRSTTVGGLAREADMARSPRLVDIRVISYRHRIDSQSPERERRVVLGNDPRYVQQATVRPA